MRSLCAALLAGLCTSFVWAPALEAAAPSEWPQFRGPARDGLSADKGLLKQWPEDGPQVVWKSEGLGIGFSSFSISDGRVCTMGDLVD